MIAKKLFFMSILFCMSAQGTEKDFNHPITRKTITDQASMSLLNLAEPEINTIRCKWLSYFKENCNTLTEHASRYIIYHYIEYKYVTALNGEKCNLITEKMFQEIFPSLCSKINMSTIPYNIMDSPIFSASKDPYIINELLYNYNLNFLDEHLIPKVISGGLNGIIKAISYFSGDEIEAPQTHNIFSLLNRYIKNGSFYIDNVLYEEESLPWRSETSKIQTPKDRIRYMKIVFSPHAYKKIMPKDFPLDLKKSFFAFLLCMKRNHKTITIPKAVWLGVITPYCEQYICAYQMYPKLIRIIERFQKARKTMKIKDDVIDFMCDDFMEWFQGFLR